MPMWISWVNPRTGKSERVYNFLDPDTPPGEFAINMARQALSRKFDLPAGAIPGFTVEKAPWRPPNPVEDLRGLGGLMGPPKS